MAIKSLKTSKTNFNCGFNLERPKQMHHNSQESCKVSSKNRPVAMKLSHRVPRTSNNPSCIPVNELNGFKVTQIKSK